MMAVSRLAGSSCARTASEAAGAGPPLGRYCGRFKLW